MNTKRFFVLIVAIAFIIINCNPVFSDSIYRFFNTATGTHFYSSSPEETNSVLNTLPQFNYEGISFSGASDSSATDISSVYRFFNNATGTHFYTMSKTEKDHILSNFPSFKFEGAAYSAHTTNSAGTSALHRFYNTKTGTHFYTANDAEKTNVQNTLPQYKYEGIAYYVETPSCTLSISPSSSNFTSSGGTGTIQITATTSNCDWTASKSLSWVSLSSTNGKGSGAISVTVSANTGTARTGSILIAGKTYKMTQAAAIPCTLGISPFFESFASSGGTNLVSVTASNSTCVWSASEALDWVSLSSTSGQGSGAISVTVSANTGATRTGFITIAEKAYTITQAAAKTTDISCVTSIFPSFGSFASSGGTSLVSVYAWGGGGCEWIASEALDWVSLSSTRETSNEKVSVTVAANTTGAARTGFITIGNKIYTIYQAGVSSRTCGAYIAPGVWKEFDCYNLAAIGKTTNDDPFTPSWRLIGGYWQWGRKGPDSSQWHTMNTANFAHGPTGPGESNSGGIKDWSSVNAPNGSWSDGVKTANDPCPAGYRVPTKAQWEGVDDNNTLSSIGTWSTSTTSNSDTNYGAALSFGSELMLPAAGARTDFVFWSYKGPLCDLGEKGYYWSSTEYEGKYGRSLNLSSSYASFFSIYSSTNGFSVRCIAE